jgi:hypothetical protein
MPSISETWGIHHPIFRDLHEMFKNELKKGSSSHIYQATRYLTFEGAFGELSKEIPICTYFFNQSRPYDVYQIHMQSNLHYLLMPVLEKHFKEAIQWSGEDPNDLIQRVAKLQYLMANACLYSRGSAAICDWVEKIIYSFHGFKPEYKIDRCINLEALTCSESEFLVEYPHCIRLRKVDPD